MKWIDSLKDTNYKTQDEMGKLNSSISIKRIDFVVKNFSSEMMLCPDDYIDKFY